MIIISREYENVINKDFYIMKDKDDNEKPNFLLIIAAASALGAMVLGGMILFGNKED